jgi:putative hydrolase of the HAD superfamily
VPIHTVFLDAGGIVVYPNWSRVSETMERHGVLVTAQALSDAEPRAKQRLDRGETIQGTNDEQRGWTYFDLVLAEAGVPLTASTAAALVELNAYHRQFNLWETVPEDVPPALAALRARGLRLVVVSNANGTLLSMFTRLGLAPAFDVVFDSHVVGIEKPDPRYFQLALEQSGARAETTVHVGDLYHVDVVGARAAGIRAILLDAGNLYADYDCPRVRTIGEVVDLIGSDSFKP